MRPRGLQGTIQAGWVGGGAAERRGPTLSLVWPLVAQVSVTPILENACPTQPGSGPWNKVFRQFPKGCLAFLWIRVPESDSPLVSTEFSISSFCTVVDVVNFSKLQVLRLDGNEIQRSAMPADAPLCLRLASLIEI